jgi:muramoyltetrapeptide carboxypeptidase
MKYSGTGYMSKIQPPFLKQGDSVGIVSPSWCIDEEKLIEAVPYLEGWGLKVKTGRNAARQDGPFAGTDEERLADLQEMTDDPDIKAVICSRGGYGMLRIISRLDFTALKTNPKWYAGFSDITVLHNWLSEVCGIISIHSDMPLNFNNLSKTPDTFSTLKSALFGDPYSIEWTGKVHRQGNAAGEITGGNLSLVYSLIGTMAEPETEGKILFLEDVGEYYYHIDRMLNSLKLAGKLRGLSALLIGGMRDITDTKIPWNRSIEETVMEAVKEYNYPVFFDFPAGHIPDNRAFYFGRRAVIKVSGESNILSF